MAEPDLGPAAALVRLHDPALFRTALFAPEPGRGRLMIIYAFDIELSRALTRTEQPMIALMRLQWWRDVLAGAAAGGVPLAHEVAGPLHALLAERPLPGPLLDGLIRARETEVEGIAGRAEFDRWADERFGGLLRLASGCLVAGAADRPEIAEAALPAGRALGVAFALRTAAPIAAGGGVPLLPGVREASRVALAQGTMDEDLRPVVRDLAQTGLAELAAARRRRAGVPAAARAAFLPVGAAEPVLRRAARADAELAALVAPNAARAAVATLWRAFSGHW